MIEMLQWIGGCVANVHTVGEDAEPLLRLQRRSVPRLPPACPLRASTPTVARAFPADIPGRSRAFFPTATPATSVPPTCSHRRHTVQTVGQWVSLRHYAAAQLLVCRYEELRELFTSFNILVSTPRPLTAAQWPPSSIRHSVWEAREPLNHNAPNMRGA